MHLLSLILSFYNQKNVVRQLCTLLSNETIDRVMFCYRDVESGVAMYLRPTAKIEMKMLTLHIKAAELLPHISLPLFTPKYTKQLFKSSSGFRYSLLL